MYNCIQLLRNLKVDRYRLQLTYTCHGAVLQLTSIKRIKRDKSWPWRKPIQRYAHIFRKYNLVPKSDEDELIVVKTEQQVQCRIIQYRTSHNYTHTYRTQFPAHMILFLTFLSFRSHARVSARQTAAHCCRFFIVRFRIFQRYINILSVPMYITVRHIEI